MRQFVIFNVLFTLVLHLAMNAQDTTYALPEVVVEGDRFAAPAGFKVTTFRKEELTRYAGEDLTDLLRKESGLAVKTNGPNLVSTLSFRGTSAEHTRLLWNDIPLTNPMLGLVDLSTIPVFGATDISIYYGSANLYTGSGSLGGGIELQSRPHFGKPVSLSLAQEAGSFGTFHTTASVEAGSDRWFSRTFLVRRSAVNDYPFENTAKAGFPIETRDHADFQQYAAGQELYFKKHHHLFSVKGFYVWGERNIPPAITSVGQNESQEDQLAAALFSYDLTRKNYHLSFTSGYRYGNIFYKNRVAEIYAENYSHSWYNIFDGTIRWGAFHLQGRFESQWQQGFADAYGQRRSLLVHGLFTSITHTTNRYFHWQVLARQELYDDEFSPFLPGAGLTVMPLGNTHWQLKTSGYRNYRYPTLNQRYWVPGGNPEIQAEKGYGLDAGTAIDQIRWNNWILNAEATAYMQWVNEWIIWLPGANGIWSPRNVKKVFSRGMDASFSLKKTKNDWLWSLHASYGLAVAKNAEVTNVQDDSHGKQLIYTPRHTLNMHTAVSYKGYRLRLGLHVTSQRFTTADNTIALDPYALGEAELSKTFNWKGHSWRLHFRVENFTNTQYQNVAWRPMPGRAYYGGVRYIFSKPN